MYGSRPVIEGTNLDANVRQAVNHFEFNAALVSKKVRWKDPSVYCAAHMEAFIWCALISEHYLHHLLVLCAADKKRCSCLAARGC